jgi:hypothetical protein
MNWNIDVLFGWQTGILPVRSEPTKSQARWAHRLQAGVP